MRVSSGLDLPGSGERRALLRVCQFRRVVPRRARNWEWRGRSQSLKIERFTTFAESFFYESLQLRAPPRVSDDAFPLLIVLMR